MSRKKSDRPSKCGRRLSRQVLDDTLTDLTERARRQVDLAEAIIRGNARTGQHTVIEYQLRQVFEVQVGALLSGLRDLHGLATILCEAETRS